MDQTDVPPTDPAPSLSIDVPQIAPSVIDDAPLPVDDTARGNRTVPYGALAEERGRRKELQRELQNTLEAQQKLQERLDLLQEVARQQGGESGTEPPVEKEAAPPVVETPHEDSGAAHTTAAFRTQVMRSVQEFANSRPDFLPAYEHARQARVAELMSLGYAPEEALGITFDNEMEIIQHAYATGRNPAEVIYRYAAQRGFQGTSPTRSTAAPGPMSEAEKVALAARGQAASKSLSAAGGGSTGNLTLEALAGMSDEEFAEATKGDRWQRLLRG